MRVFGCENLQKPWVISEDALEFSQGVCLSSDDLEEVVKTSYFKDLIDLRRNLAQYQFASAIRNSSLNPDEFGDCGAGHVFNIFKIDHHFVGTNINKFDQFSTHGVNIFLFHDLIIRKDQGNQSHISIKGTFGKSWWRHVQYLAFLVVKGQS